MNISGCLMIVACRFHLRGRWHRQPEEEIAPLKRNMGTRHRYVDEIAPADAQVPFFLHRYVPNFPEIFVLLLIKLHQPTDLPLSDHAHPYWLIQTTPIQSPLTNSNIHHQHFILIWWLLIWYVLMANHHDQIVSLWLMHYFNWDWIGTSYGVDWTLWTSTRCDFMAGGGRKMTNKLIMWRTHLTVIAGDEPVGMVGK